MKIVLLINGPAGSGKTTLLRKLSEILNLKTVDYNNPLLDLCSRMSGLGQNFYQLMEDRSTKNIPNKYLTVRGLPLSPRKYMQHVAEIAIKPVFGVSSIAGLLNVKQSLRDVEGLVISVGYEEEIKHIKEELRNIEDCELLLIRLHKTGCTFKTCGRSYLRDDDIPSFDVENKEGELPATVEKIIKTVREAQCNNH